MTAEADLAIVGAGPAGAAAACHFARAGFHVVLLDQHRFPRDKVCGDFVGPWALEEVDRLGLSADAPFCDANKIRSAALHLNGAKIVGASIPRLRGLRDHGLCIPRLRLDEAIVRAAIVAGTRLFQEAHVTGYETEANGVNVYYRGGSRLQCLRTRLLLGADGSTSLIARILRGKRSSRRDRIIAVRAYFEDVRGARDQAGLYANSTVFPGYYWLFPTGESSANVGVGMLLETWPPNREHLHQLLSDLIRSDPAMRSRLRSSRMCSKIAGWPLATFNPYLPIVADRVALLGDAAGLINPLNGEGIQYAFQSARWSVETLSDALAHDNVSKARLAAYVDRVHCEMRLDMAVSRLLVDFSRNRTFNQLWLAALRVIGARAALDSEYADVFGGVLAGIARARQLLETPFVWRTVKHAASMTGWSNGIDLLQGCASAALRSARHPLATLDWITQCVITTLELATQLEHGRRSSTVKYPSA